LEAETDSDPSADKTVFEFTIKLHEEEDGDHKYLSVVVKALVSEKRDKDRKWTFIAMNKQS
jgi:hypothetical protein